MWVKVLHLNMTDHDSVKNFFGLFTFSPCGYINLINIIHSFIQGQKFDESGFIQWNDQFLFQIVPWDFQWTSPSEMPSSCFLVPTNLKI